MDFRVLGPLEVFEGDRALDLGGPKQRAVLAQLVLHAGHVVAIDRLIDEVWGEGPPDAVMASLQATISRLRRLIGSDRIEGRPAGYVLRADAEEVDASRFERLVRDARRMVATDPRQASVLLRQALATWRGEPLSDVPAGPFLRAGIAALEQLRLAAIEDHVGLQLALGNEREVIADVQTWLAENPLHERLWGQLMTALYRAGRQADALAAYGKACRHLREELGVDPSAELEQLHQQVVRHDPALAVRGLPLRGYLLLDQIGEGAFGVVHRAIQPGVGREVALKAVRPRLAHHPDFVRRFEAEAQLVARLEHPYIVPLYDYWRDADGAYLVMRWLRGGSLKRLLSDGPLDTDHAARLTEQVASALAAAHRVGVIHRDVKPANILLDEEGNAYLSDFGIARELATTTAPAAAADETTRYMSPEEVRGEPVTPRTDIYALGVVLYEMLVGRHPFEHPRDKQRPVPPSLLGPELPRELDEVIARAMAQEPTERHADVDELVAAVRRALPAPGLPVVPPELAAEPPYKGLRAFGEPDAADFFGRESLTEELIGRLSQPGLDGRFLAVVGASGSGKSSLVHAGLLPALRRGAVVGAERWFIAHLHPGSDPLAELSDALERVAPDPPAGVARLIRGDPSALARIARQSLPPGAELLLVVDQFEELFTLTTDDAARRRFLDALAQAVTDGDSRLRAVITLRADFLDRPLVHHRFASLLRPRMAVVVPLSPEQIQRAIAAPAARRGVTVEAALVARMVADVADQPAALPLLQYALTEIYAQRAGTGLTLGDYRAIGGISGAIARRADQLYGALAAAGPDAARQIFLRLVTLGEGADETRRRVPRSELEALGLDRDAVDSVLSAYGSHRLLSFDRDPQTREPTVEVAHEALLREWPRLRAWIDAAREDLRQQRALAAAANDWLAAERDASFLLHGARLAQAEAWAAETSLALSDAERQLLAASRAERDTLEAAEAVRQARERELERRSLTRLRALAAVLASGALVAGGLAVFAFDQESQAQAQRVAAETERAAAETERARAEEQRLIAEAEQARAEQHVRFATARELAAASGANLSVDPDLSIHLALEAVEVTRSPDGVVLREAEEALHGAVLAARVIERRPAQDTLVLSPVSARPYERASGTAAVLITPVGRFRASADGDAITLADDATGRQIARLPIERLNKLAFSPDGRYLATGDVRGPPTVWDLMGTSEPVRLPGEDGYLDSMAFSPDSSMLAAMTVDGAARIWQVATGNELASIPMTEGWGIALSWRSDSAALAVAANTHSLVVAVPSGERILLIERDGRSITYSPDDGLLLATGQDTASLWDAVAGVRLFDLDGHDGFVNAVAFSADGKLAATGAHDGQARLWEVETGQLVLTLPGLGSSVDYVTFNEDGTALLAGGAAGELVWDIRPQGSRESLTIDTAFGGIGAVAYHPAQDLILTGSTDGGVRLWDAASGELVREFVGHEGPVVAVRFSADGTLVATASFDTTAAVWETATGELVRRFEGHRAACWGIALSPDASRLVSVSEDRTARVWDVATGAQLLVFAGHDDSVYDVAWSPDGSVVVSTGNDFAGRIWDPTSGQQLALLRHDENVVEQAFSPDGRQVATAGFDNRAKVWDVASGQEAFTLGGHGGIVLDVEASPDGLRWATTSLDGTVRLWDSATGREVLSVPIGPAPGIRLAFSPDSRRLAVISPDGLVRLLALVVEELVQLARERVSRPLSETECRQYLRLDGCPAEAGSR